MNAVAVIETILETKKPKVFKGMSKVAVMQLPDDMSTSRYTINSEPVLLGPPAGKTGAGYRWTVREGWVVREDGRQIGAFITKQEAMAFRDSRSPDDDDAPDKGCLFRQSNIGIARSGDKQTV
jgi:hypothetical protein